MKDKEVLEKNITAVSKDTCIFKSAQITGNYRYYLIRRWNTKKQVLMWVMLNPSTADDENDDHTIRKIVGFSKRFNAGTAIVVNLYAYRATNPSLLFRNPKVDYIGKANDHTLKKYKSFADKIVFACGTHAKPERLIEVYNMLRPQYGDIYCLKKNKDGTPAHPARLPYNSRLIPYRLKYYRSDKKFFACIPFQNLNHNKGRSDKTIQSGVLR
ncbi:MAG: DUF1643 domain-containing protein [Spirochaetales bacterium]|nr:DUF1643 domain-containing protein [Spirochaetales bacterium]